MLTSVVVASGAAVMDPPGVGVQQICAYTLVRRTCIYPLDGVANHAVVKWVVATVWATVAAVALGCAQPAPALTTPAAPVSTGVAGEATKENLTAGVETSHATEEASLQAAAVYLYVLIRSR